LLKKRIIPVFLLQAERFVKTQKFTSPRDVGNPLSALKIYNSQSADEIVVLNIETSKPSLEYLKRLIGKAAEFLTAPVAVGGYIRTLQDISSLISCGADKIVVNTLCYESPEDVIAAVHKFGSQAIIASVDLKFDQASQSYHLYSNAGQILQNRTLEEHLNLLESIGVGEIMINSIEHDGMMCGYDLILAKQVVECSKVPIIMAGGAGNFQHLVDAFESCNLSGVGCSSLFHFGDNNPVRASSYLSGKGIKLKI
jgi:cyclase